VGVEELLAGIAELLSAPRGDPDAPVSGRVFKIERTTSGERVAYARLFTGTLRPRQRVRVGGGDDAKAASVRAFAPMGAPRRDVVTAGEMATIRGLGAVRVGDAIGEPPPGGAVAARFPRPALEAVVFARSPEQSGSLRAALSQLAEQDPLIDVRQDDSRHEIAVSLYGEVQKEVIGATLEREYGIGADFRETTTVCIERPARVGEAKEIIRAKTKTNITGRSSPLSTNPFTATLALRIEPAPPGSGVEFRTDLEVRLVPLYLFKAGESFATQMEAYVREALCEGLAGWQVTDCRVTMTDCGYLSPVTSAADLRRLAQLVVAEALERAGTWVCEPLADLSLEMPASTAQGVLATLGRLGGRATGQFSANGLTRASAVLPVAGVRSMQHQLPGLSMGEGILETRPGAYQPVGSDPPLPRTLDAEPAGPRRLAGVAGEARMTGARVTAADRHGPVADRSAPRAFRNGRGGPHPDREAAPRRALHQAVPPGSGRARRRRRVSRAAEPARCDRRRRLDHRPPRARPPSPRGPPPPGCASPGERRPVDAGTQRMPRTSLLAPHRPRPWCLRLGPP
jgi:ribosomal protection tetracycline resistance protein